MRPLVHFPHEFHNFISASRRPACRLTSHLLMTRMMPFSRSKPLILKSSQQNFHNELLPFKSDYSLQNVDSQRNLHRLFAHAMDWAQPIPAFQRQVIINPHRSGGEIKQVFEDIKNQFHQRRDRLAASPATLFPTFNDKIVSIPMGTEVKSIQFWWNWKSISIAAREIGSKSKYIAACRWRRAMSYQQRNSEDCVLSGK